MDTLPPLKVNIVSYEDVNSWILGKFAKKLHENLTSLGLEATISHTPDVKADINHHIIANQYDIKKNIPHKDTLMITHIDAVIKLQVLQNALRSGAFGICMSKETMNKLISCNIPINRISYINPAHDFITKPRKFVMGITNRVYTDFRKRESMLIDICSNINTEDFAFKIMGKGWQPIIEKLKEMGVEVTYYENFEIEQYKELMRSLDYFLYWGYDEGTMGFLDAVATGVKTIVTPQGYHLDIKDGITHPCCTLTDFIDTFKKISEERRQRIQSVSQLSWNNYTIKHLEIWYYLTGKLPLPLILQHRGLYNDGIFSTMLYSI